MSYHSIVLEISTRHSMGIGFLLADQGLVITTAKLVSGHATVVVNSSFIKKQSVDLVYLDQQQDLALLTAPDYETDLANLTLAANKPFKSGNPIIILGSTSKKSYLYTTGHIREQDSEHGSSPYIYHDAAVMLAYIGAPILSEHFELIGMNISKSTTKQNLSKALKAGYIHESIKSYRRANSHRAMRCHHCQGITPASASISCIHCGTSFQGLSLFTQHETHGVSRIIEDLLESMDYDVPVARLGRDTWRIHKGSARIHLAYHSQSGLIICDAVLCTMPDHAAEDCYIFLLQQNHRLDGLTFSVVDDKIILSLLIYDQYLDLATAKKLFQKLFDTADYYDDVLVEQFGARWQVI